MNRRNFGTSVLGAAVALGLNPGIAKNKMVYKRTIKPPKLEEGDVVGLIAPASLVSEEKVERSIENIKNLGFEVMEGKFLRTNYGNFSARDEDRLSDLHSMYRNPDVNAIWCARGGYGCTRILSSIDYKLIRNKPKILIGYSDVTALLNAIYQETGIIGFHGPVGASLQNDFNNRSFKALLVDRVSSHTYSNFSSEDYLPLGILNNENMIVEGRTAGGNLSLMAAMVGTDHAIEYKDKIVIIEDIGEAPYRIDRMLTQLLEGSDLRKCRGIILGQFLNCEAKDLEKELSLEQVFRDRLLPLNVPILNGLNFGHVDHNVTIPIGAKLKLDPIKMECSVIESVVS